MNVITQLPEVNVSVNATSNSYVFVWLTGWLPFIAIDAIMATLKLANCAGSVAVAPAIQYAANRTDKPGTPSAIAGYTAKASDNEYVVKTSDYAITPSSNNYVRLGIAVKCTSGSLGTADVAFQPCFLQLGRMLPAWAGHLTATSAVPIITPITAMMPALNLTKVQASIVIGDKSGNISVDLVARTAAASPEVPDAWGSGLLLAALTGDGETNSGERAVTTTDKMWVQFGISIACTSGTPVQADITVILSIRQAT